MKNLNAYLDVSPEVAAALAENRPVVALESTIISHGMPYPQNVETALHVESIVREQGAVPATVAVINGRLRAGLTPEEIDYLGRKGREVIKVSRRDLPVVVARGLDGATTVASTMRRWRSSRALPRVALVACIVGLRPLWTSRLTSRSWR